LKPWILTLLLAGLAMVGPFATDTYLPSFPGLARHFAVSAAMVQQTLSVYLFAYALMTLFYGTLSDSLGRRPVILFSLLLFCAASIGAALAQTFGQLLAMRAMQGLSAGAGMVVGQALVRDRLDGAAAQRTIAHVMMVFGVAPALAPIIGGWLEVSYGWRANFTLMAGIALLLLGACARWLPESLAPAARHPFHAGAILRRFGAALGNRCFLLRSLAIGALFGSFGLYVASAASFIMHVLHLPATAFAWLFVPMIGGFVAGSALSAKLAHSHGAPAMIRAGFVIMAFAALANLAYTWRAAATVPWAVLPIFVYTFGLALALPPMTLLTLDLYPQLRGLAASMQNFVQMLVFALVAAFVAPLLFDSAFKLAAGMGAGMAISWLCWRLAPPAATAVARPATFQTVGVRSGKRRLRS
jgi:DHA1 family bicyclomycin/chloramphenicol resistance-like MFS transporter